MDGSPESGRPAGQDGHPDAGLPPRAPAYDLRTGEPLDSAEPLEHEGDFTGSDLGIWAPGQDEGTTPNKPAQGEEHPQTPPYQQIPYQQIPYQQAPTYQQPGYGTDPRQAPPYQQQGYGTDPRQAPPYQQQGYGTDPRQAYPPTAGGGYGPPGSTAPQPVTPAPRGRGPVVLAGTVALLVVVAAVLGAVLLLGGSPKTPVASTGTPSVGTASQAPTGLPTAASATAGEVDRSAFLHTVDGILTESASGRQQVVAAVNGVLANCGVAPQDASATLGEVIVNRQSVLGQANALVPPDAATSAVKSDLVQALTASIEANQGYQQWLNNLTATFSNVTPVGCPNGSAPTDANYNAATAASGRATAAKRAFVATYNPMASAAGLRTWQETEF